MTDQDPWDRTTPLDSPADRSEQPQAGDGVLWKVLTGLFAVTAVGLAIWAFTLNADAQSVEGAAASEIASLEADNEDLADQVATLEEENATLGEQNAALEEEIATLEEENADLLEQSQQLSQDARRAIRQAIAALGDLAEQQAITEQQVADVTAALQAATDALAVAEGDLATAQAERDQAVALAEAGRLCAAGSVTATRLLSEGDVDGAVASLTSVASACEAASAAENQPQ